MPEVSVSDLVVLTVYLARIEHHRTCEYSDASYEDRGLCLENILTGFKVLELNGTLERLEQALLEAEDS